MNYSTWFRMAWVLLAAAGALVVTQPTLANPIVPFTLAFEREGLDDQHVPVVTDRTGAEGDPSQRFVLVSIVGWWRGLVEGRQW